MKGVRGKEGQRVRGAREGKKECKIQSRDEVAEGCRGKKRSGATCKGGTQCRAGGIGQQRKERAL